MIILIINKYCPLHPNGVGGAEKRLEEIFSRLTKKHEVYLLCSRFPNSKAQETYKGIKIIRIGPQTKVNDYFSHVIIPLSLRKYAKKIKPDVIYEDVTQLPWFSPFILKKYKRVSIFHHLNGKELFFARKDFFLPISLFIESIAVIWERLFFLFYKKEKVICVSVYMKKMLQKRNFKDITLIKNPVNTLFYGPKKSLSRNPRIIFIGGKLGKRKRPENLLNTFAYVKKQIPNCEYIIIGEGPSLKKYKKKYNHNDIHFLGGISDKEKKEQLQKSWILAFPSAREGYGIVALEANATGTPVLANNIQGLNESVINGKTGFLIDFSNTKLASKKIIRLLKNKKKIEGMKADCIQWAKKHSPKIAAKETEKILSS